MPRLLQVNTLLCRDQLSNPEQPLMLPQREWLHPAKNTHAVLSGYIASLHTAECCMVFHPTCFSTQSICL
jgi:hypothetical protein